MKWSVLAPASLGAVLAAAKQAPFGSALGAAVSSADGVVELSSHHYPDSRVKVKQHRRDWCDPKANSYTGYIDAGDGQELFFYFFESRSKPSEDPVVMWINGGPGASSAMGAFLEQGPCRINDHPETVNDTHINPYAWTEKANVFFLEQPVGVGWSHAEHGQRPRTTQEAMVAVAAFIDIFFDVFDEFKGRPFHMTGESYGGRYLPIFASAVYDQNARLIKEGREPVNLKSVMIGNGLGSLVREVESTYEFMCTPHIDLGYTIMDIGNCVSLAEQIPRCVNALQKYCIDTSDYTSCAIWHSHCVPLWTSTPRIIDRVWYNMDQPCNATQNEIDQCFPAGLDLERYMNLPDVQAMLGVDGHTPAWTGSSRQVNMDFMSTLDWTRKTWHYTANLLERGIKVLNYVGTLDAACDHIHQSKWMNDMEWSGQEAWRAAETKDWLVDGEKKGLVKSYKNLTLFGGGHLVPTDRPKEALAMLEQWLAVAN